MVVNVEFEKNREVLEVLRRFKSRNKRVLDGTFLGRTFGRANIVKPGKLKRLFGERGVDFYRFDEFLIEDPRKYSGGEWGDTGGREGYDGGYKTFEETSSEKS